MELVDLKSKTTLLSVSEHQLRLPLLKIFGSRKTRYGKKAAVTPHDLRRLFKTAGTEIGIDPTIMNLLVGHSPRGVDKSYIASPRLGVLGAAVQKIADEIDNPQELPGEENFTLIDSAYSSPDVSVSASQPPSADGQQFFPSAGDYLLANDPGVVQALTRSPRYSHYLRRNDLYELVWTAPIQELAVRFGLSGTALSKVCRRASIPVPPRGYWSKIDSGLHVVPPRLPTAPKRLPEIIRIRGTIPPPERPAKNVP